MAGWYSGVVLILVVVVLVVDVGVSRLITGLKPCFCCLHAVVVGLSGIVRKRPRNVVERIFMYCQCELKVSDAGGI